MTLYRLLRRNALAADLTFRPTIPPRRNLNQFLELIAVSGAAMNFGLIASAS
jgi:hypothetical protein